MMSSSSAIALAPAHPEAAENQSETVDEGHPQRKFVADEEVTDQRQRGDDRADRDERHSEPQSDHRIDQHEIERPERAELTRREMAEHARDEKAQREEHEDSGQHPDVEGVHAGSGITDDTEREPAGNAEHIDRYPGSVRI